MVDRLKDHVYYYDEIVIGNNLSAALYAHKNGCYFVYNIADGIFSLDLIDSEIKLENLTFAAGSYKKQVIAEILYNITLKGLNSVSGKIQSIRVEKDKLKIVTGNSKIIQIKYDKLRIFNLDKISFLPLQVNEEIKSYRTLDWFNVRSGMKHEHDFLFDGCTNFVNKIYFYSSNRIDGNTRDYKDLVAESFLDKKQINDINYSDSISRLKVLNMMKTSGIKGTSNGKDIKGNQRYLPIKIELDRRDIFPIKKISCEVESEKIIIDSRDTEQVYRSFSEQRT